MGFIHNRTPLPYKHSKSTETTVPNAKRLLWAGFMAILAAGVGFALRGGIFGAWASEYGFNASQLGAIGGAGFSGFCFGIIIGGVINFHGFGVVNFKLIQSAFRRNFRKCKSHFTGGREFSLIIGFIGFSFSFLTWIFTFFDFSLFPNWL